jgi:capping protein alpha
MSAADQVKIANNFLLNAPPGEFMEVVTDVKTLLPQAGMLDSSAPTTFKRYNEDQMVQADSEDGSHRFLITPYAELGTNEYIDHAGGVVATFDHIKQVVTSSRPIGASDGDSSLEDLRSALDKGVAQYVKDHYPFGTYGVYAKDGKIYICITSTRFNPSNFWNGRWRSVWTVPAKSGSGDIEGRIRLQVHYYEDGNVQLHTETLKAAKVANLSDAAAVVKALTTVEHNFHQALDASYTVMGETTFKALRRALPITGQKINWNLIHSYRVGGEAASGKQ